MKKALITGATSSHGSLEAHNRISRFAGLLNSSLSFSSVQSHMGFVPFNTPKSELDENDLIVVGISPISSLSANKFYNSLKVINHFKGSSKLKIMIDAPDPHLAFQSYKSVLSKPELLTKSLYSAREGYSQVADSPTEMLSAMEFLLSGDYDLIVPSMPYKTISRSEYGIPEGGQTFNYNFDYIFMNNFHISEKASARYWLAENAKTKWATDISKTVKNPVLGVKRNAYDTSKDYVSRMQNSYGFLLNTYRNGLPWWSLNIMLALSCGVPVFSDWRYTSELGLSWSGLPHSAEDMNQIDRLVLSQNQLKVYAEKVPSIEEISVQLKEQLL